MNKTQAKANIKKHGLYNALYVLASMRYNEATDMIEIFERVLDNIPEDIIKKAITKGTR